MIQAQLDSIQDKASVDALRRILEQLNQIPIIKGKWKFIEYKANSALVGQTLPHLLKFRPKDAILLSTTNNQTVTFNYDDFTDSTINFDTSGPTTIRAFIGSYQEG